MERARSYANPPAHVWQLEIDHANLTSGTPGLISLIQVCGIRKTDALALQLSCATMNVPKQMNLWFFASDGIEQLGASEMHHVARALIEIPTGGVCVISTSRCSEMLSQYFAAAVPRGYMKAP